MKQIIYVVLFLALATILFIRANEKILAVLTERHLSNTSRRFE